MILVDTALQAREKAGNPVRVGLIGAGFMVQGLTNMIVNSTPGMRVVAISNRHPHRAIDVFRYAGRDPVLVDSAFEFEQAACAGQPIVTEDPSLICGSPDVDVVVEATGHVDFGLHVTLDAMKHGKSVVLMNAELDATLGPILQIYAKRYGVILSACDGDEPGVQMNLYRWVKGLGLTPRVLANVRGLHDPYRNPTTQAGFAQKWGQNPAMVTSFADGSKTSFEQSIVANATGFKVRSRGMSRGLEYRGDIMEIGKVYDLDELRELGGIVDYVVGTPLTKIFCLAEHPDPKQQHYLDLYKMGSGPLYSFFIPYHLVHFEVPSAIARVALFGDSLAKPLGAPFVQVCTVAKRDLLQGEVLDLPGEYMTYGEACNAEEMEEQDYLPEGLTEGCTLKRAIKRDEVIRYTDVALPEGRLADQFLVEQRMHFGATRPERSRPSERKATGRDNQLAAPTFVN
jgi:predicted homoserine dehydrogenase-like protein